MKAIDLCLFLTSYTFVVAFAALIQFLRRQRWPEFIMVMAALTGVSAVTVVGFYLEPDKTYLDVLRYLIGERDFSTVVALVMGVAAAAAWLRRGAEWDEEGTHTWKRFEPLLLALSILLVVACGHAFIWKEVLGITRHAVEVYAPEFVIDKVATLDEQPIRITASQDGSIYICFDYFKKHGAIGGAVLHLWEDSATSHRAFQQRIVVESPFLVRVYGLAVHEGDLFVSRSGFFPKTHQGVVSYEATGAITRLEDVDGDGYFEYADDVVTGLPGVRGPDTMQQNNAIVFDVDGSLLVTNASAADRTLDEHPWAGTILRVSPDFQQIEVVARGLRNPWSIALGPDQEVFLTDSDVDKNPGDEINHLVPGSHFGHPFIIPGEVGVEPEGFREPILVGERETVFCGIAYSNATKLPETYRNCLYVTDFRQDKVLRLELERTGDTYRVTSVHPFASIPSPVDITVTPDGEFFVISRRAQKVFRIRPK